MTQNQLKALLRRVLLEGLRSYGVTDVPVIDGYQPTAQGREPRGLYFFPLAESRYGWQYRKDRFDPATDDQVHTETQHLRSTYQVGGFAEHALHDATVLTAHDLTGVAAMVLAASPSLAAFKCGGAGVERITAVRTLFVENDHGRQESVPSFDITLTHKQTLTHRTPSVEAFEHAFTRV